MSSFWRNFHHWLYRKLSKWQLSVQSVIKISSKWHFRFSEVHLILSFTCSVDDYFKRSVMWSAFPCQEAPSILPIMLHTRFPFRKYLPHEVLSSHLLTRVEVASVSHDERHDIGGVFHKDVFVNIASFQHFTENSGRTGKHGGITVDLNHNENDGVSNHRRLDSLAQPLVQAQIRENINAPRHWPLWGEFTGDPWMPHTKGQ